MVDGVFKNPFATMYVLNGLFILAWLITVELLLGRLRREHSAVHKQLGEPSLFSNNTISNGLRVLGFVLTGKYRAVPDEYVRKLGNLARGLLLIVLATGAVTTTLFFSQSP